jgi:hypothetical protein
MSRKAFSYIFILLFVLNLMYSMAATCVAGGVGGLPAPARACKSQGTVLHPIKRTQVITGPIHHEFTRSTAVYGSWRVSFTSVAVFMEQ